jgi:Ca-activated chloride channel family protein
MKIDCSATKTSTTTERTPATWRHTVTALFEVVPSGVEIDLPSVDALRYTEAAPAAATAMRLDSRARSAEMLHIKIRYKEPAGTASQLIDLPVSDRNTSFNNATPDFRFAASAASFGMILRDSPHKGQSNLDSVIEMAERSRSADRGGYREEFVQLVRKAQALKQRR